MKSDGIVLVMAILFMSIYTGRSCRLALVCKEEMLSRPPFACKQPHCDQFCARLHPKGWGKYKLDYSLQVTIRSGGHDYEGLSSISEVPFIILDLNNLRSIHASTTDNTAWIESGATVGELYYWIAQKSSTLGFPAGICPTPGIGGHTSGGGFGTVLRKYGLAADSVIDAHVLDVNGQILDRESMGRDLFWAIREGGGGSFGVIYSCLEDQASPCSRSYPSGETMDALKNRKPQPKSYFKAASDYVQEPLSTAALEDLWKWCLEEESPAVIFDPYGG
ncbi:O-acetylstemmadenine oxidase-like [Coffea arabica]|uniref:O-acetylstemmadenine oxidase-like n=1 Tax=Coffea arabica TaxID=13443 RepID=A0ABM4V9A5_COFAR